MEDKFKVGDRVKAKYLDPCITSGDELGTVFDVEELCVGVRFDNPVWFTYINIGMDESFYNPSELILVEDNTNE
jgi:hypothetical protein